MVKLKGVDYLIKAFGVLDDPESSLVIVGYGDEEENLKKLVEELKIDNVEPIGDYKNLIGDKDRIYDNGGAVILGGF